jgi:hypothetical protein
MFGACMGILSIIEVTNLFLLERLYIGYGNVEYYA